MRERAEETWDAVAGALERLGIIDKDQLRSTLDLAWPRIVTGFAMMSKQTADLAMVGIAVGSAGVAGLAFALAYWRLSVTIGLGLAGGTISLVAQNYGGDEWKRASTAVNQSVLVAVVISLPIAVGYALFAGPLIELLGSGGDSIRYGSVYLFIVAPAVVFEYFNRIASRTYAGVGDTFTPMVARGGGAVVNVVLSAAFIFGAGMGVAGAALGTLVATVFVTLALAWGMFGQSYDVLGMAASPVPMRLRGPWLDRELVRQLLEISTPLMGRRIAEALLVFPLLWIAASFGPVVVAALEVGRRVRELINSINWGFTIASSSLVGQYLGANDEMRAEGYGAAIIRLSVAIYVGIAALVVLFATPIASVFVGGPDEIAQAATFVAVGAVSAVGMGIDGAATGTLRGAGDTRLPFVASLIGRYLFALPAAALGLVTPLGVTGLYAALLLEAYVPGGINFWLFRTGRWKAVSRKYRPSAAPESE